MEESILYEINGAGAEITLNRPDVLNSFNRPMARRMQEVLAEAERDEAVRSVLLKAAGRAFCAGQDLAEAAPSDGSPPADVGELVRTGYNPIVRSIRRIEKPFVCAVGGVAAGAGANLALACDLVLASTQASFLQAFCKIGLIPDSGGTYFLPRLAGLARAAAMTMLGERISAQQALEFGMIYKVVEPENLETEARELAQRLAAQPTRGLGLTKRALNQSLANSLDAQLEVEEKLQGKASKTHDYQEGVAAFLEKRKPRFKGK